MIYKLPKNTNVSTYFTYKDATFEEMKLPDGRILIMRVYVWDDGEIMDFGFEYSDGIPRTGINPLHIVGIFYDDIKEDIYASLDKWIELDKERVGMCNEN